MTATKTTSRRIPKTLKKKLEASLKSLTPREAGRLVLIYLHEANKDKDDPVFFEYRPIKELEDAWEARVAAARKLAPIEVNQQKAFYNGFRLLSNLILTANDWADREFYRLSYLDAIAGSTIEVSLLEDAFDQMALITAKNITRDTPFPVSREDYKRMLAKVDDFHFEFKTAIDEFMGAWGSDQGFDQKDNVLILAILEAHNKGPEVAAIVNELPDVEGDPKIRRLFIESKPGQDWAAELFQGDTEALQEWVTNGHARDGWAGPGLTAKIWEEKKQAFADQLEGLIAEGKLQTFTAAGLSDCFDSIRIDDDGSIPTWAALRAIWRGWLVDHNFLIKATTKIDPAALRGVMAVYSIDGDLEDEDLVNVVAEFVADCTAKPWGDGIATDIDLTRLAHFLIAVETPLTEDDGEALQLGRVNFQAFAESDGDDGLQPEETFTVARACDLRSIAPDLGLTIDGLAGEEDDLAKAKDEDLVTYLHFDESRLVTDYYYPTEDPEDRRDNLARIMRMIESLRSDYGPLAFRKRATSGQFTAELKDAIKTLGETFGQVAIFRTALDLISDEYFAGLPVLLPYMEKRFVNFEAILQATEEHLTDWLQLEGAPWRIDTTALQLVKAEADEERAREKSQMIKDSNLRMSGMLWSQFEIDLGDGEDPRVKPKKADDPPAKKKKTAGKEEDRHE